MILECIRYDLAAHSGEQLIEAYRAAAPHLRAAPECLGFELSRCEEAPASFVLLIRWQSTQAHMQGFRRGPHFPPFLAAIRPFAGEIAEMRHYAPTELSWQRGQAASAS